jgi:hypothetical protein
MKHLRPLLRLMLAGAVLTLSCCATMEVRQPVAGCKVEQDWLFDRIDNHPDPLCLQHFIDAADNTYQLTAEQPAATGPENAGVPNPALPDGKNSVTIAFSGSHADVAGKDGDGKDINTKTETTNLLLSFSKTTVVPKTAAPSARPDAKPAPGGQAGAPQAPPPAPAFAYDTPIVVAARQVTIHRDRDDQMTVRIEAAAPGADAKKAESFKATQEQRKAVLLAMYQTASSYCLYYKNKSAFAYKFGINIYNFGDLLVAAAVPVAAFSDATPDSIALVSGLVTILGGPLKNALGSADPGQDYSQTFGGMSAVYDLFSKNEGFTGNPNPGVNVRDMFQIYRTGLEQTCFSTLKFAAAGKSGG